MWLTHPQRIHLILCSNNRTANVPPTSTQTARISPPIHTSHAPRQSFHRRSSTVKLQSNGRFYKYTSPLRAVTEPQKPAESSLERASEKPLAMEKEREQQVYLARLAEQAERYDGTAIRFSAITFSVCVYACVFLWNWDFLWLLWISK